MRLPEDDDGLVTSFILVGALSACQGRERERERESQVHLVSHFEEHSPGVTMTREFILFWNFMPQHFLLFFIKLLLL